MICDHCKKNPASIFMTQTVNGVQTDVKLCQNCAQSLQIENNFAVFSFQDILKGMVESFLPTTEQKSDETFQCPRCHTSYAEFTKSGFLGCSNCYQSFNKQLIPILKQLNGNASHHGKFPKKADIRIKIKKDILQLKQKLTSAIAEEKFEEAARLRDEIKLLEGGLTHGKMV